MSSQSLKIIGSKFHISFFKTFQLNKQEQEQKKMILIQIYWKIEKKKIYPEPVSKISKSTSWKREKQ